ncbi:hypothetical protein DM01DRAFT_1406891 [Hesseltinella vesiculosa]|uniref:Velvet domain-containing protein n=1 Tax=Hesseltinella vesiculosa TaxID=101127 RepID=A0A1X2GK71_9FUNG|nr:hypothetical protein DM01DRAFT_1406891 [Hesseltinella vesiculosa]
MPQRSKLFEPCLTSSHCRSMLADDSLVVAQQPRLALVSSHKERGRKVLDPPPIVRLRPEVCPRYQSLLHSPCLWLCANLAHPRDNTEIYTPNHLALAGQVVSSLFKYHDEQGQVQGYFILGDLSVKVAGTYRLRLSLFDVTSEGASYMTSIFTQPFDVYPVNSIGPSPCATPLSKCLSSQGARIRIPRPPQAPTKRLWMADEGRDSTHANESPVTPPCTELASLQNVLPFFNDVSIHLPPIKRQSITRPWNQASTLTLLPPCLP